METPKKIEQIKFYPGNLEIFDNEGNNYSISFDGFKGVLTREEWQEDEVIQIFDEDSQERILNDLELHQIIK